MMDRWHYHQRLKKDVHLYMEGWTLVACILQVKKSGKNKGVRSYTHLFNEKATPANHRNKFAVNYLMKCDPISEAVERILTNETKNAHLVRWLGDFRNPDQLYCGWNLEYFHRLVARYKRYCAFVKGEKS